MRQIMFALAVVGGVSAVATMANVSPAEARDFPYCLQGDGYGIPGDCSYDTYEQCRASASGRRAYCDINPRYAFSHRNDAYGRQVPPRRTRQHPTGY
ncbi:MAG TPA: DUF3551 domain-containing protein [Xanthobacteraceae bacterium]|nr:DUF3551 domain-containing protein [Xanthobacteraceae bacterium]